MKFMLEEGFIAKAPGVAYFPGDFDTPPPLHSVDIEITTRRTWKSYTGYYLRAGVEAIVKVQDIQGFSHWVTRGRFLS